MSNNDLLSIGKKFETDKVTHFYLPHYEKILSHLRDSHIKILEIGVFKGASIRMWREYFPNAEIHCVDINEINLSDLNNVTMHIVDCDSKESLKSFAEKLGEFDVIIDDGGHTMRQQQNALEVLWPNLKKGGIFIMEDMHTSIKEFYPEYNVENQPTTYDLFISLLQKERFQSSYISATSFEDIKSSVDKVEIIWSKKIISNNPKRPFNASITSYLTKI